MRKFNFTHQTLIAAKLTVLISARGKCIFSYSVFVLLLIDVPMLLCDVD